jgi:hypothetical protein
VQFTNETKVAAGWTMGFDRDARELLVVAVKATFTIPTDGEEPRLAETQLPLVEADEFTGAPGLSAPLRESDYAHRKLRCDVLVNGSAYAPEGKPTERVTVGVRVGSMSKSFDVVGQRIWLEGVLGTVPSTPRPFRAMFLSYDVAFGGVDDSVPENPRTFPSNPVGIGYYPRARKIEGKPAPSTEATGVPIKGPGENYQPMSFGPVGRNWHPRVAYAGTYDQAWLDRQAPFWPDDFQYLYFQSAPADQQIDYPAGGEPVVLLNLTPDGIVRFQLPSVNMPVLLIPHGGHDQQFDANLDTVLIEPDFGRFTLTWRVAVPMRKSCFDIRETIAGELPRDWHRARRTRGKRHYANLSELIAAQQKRRP